MHSFKTALLASSVLTTVSFGASATTYTGPFSTTPPGPDVNFSMFQSASGTLNFMTDRDSFFTFTGLTSGDDFTVTFNREALGANTFGFTADAFAETLLGPGGTTMESGVLAGASLSIHVRDTGPVSDSSLAEGYSVSLTQTPATVPEPSAAAIFAIGIAGLAMARRKRQS